MLVRTVVVGAALLAAAVPVVAQQRGTIEFGAFGSNTGFDNSLGMNGTLGGGVRIGAFLSSRASIEFEGGGGKAGRTLGRESVNVGVLSARVTGVPLITGKVSFLLGAGVDHTDTWFLESYGIHGLVGAKYALSENLAIRMDGIVSRMMNGDATNFSLHAGVSFYRKP